MYAKLRNSLVVVAMVSLALMTSMIFGLVKSDAWLLVATIIALLSIGINVLISDTANESPLDWDDRHMSLTQTSFNVALASTCLTWLFSVLNVSPLTYISAITLFVAACVATALSITMVGKINTLNDRM